MNSYSLSSVNYSMLVKGCGTGGRSRLATVDLLNAVSLFLPFALQILNWI